MFFKCNSLASLPDISKWDRQNVVEMNLMFDGCSKLSMRPNLRKKKE